MRLSQILAPQVPSQSRARGSAYFNSGAVRSIGAEAGVIQATVRGTEQYQVWLEPVGALLRAACTCPYFIDRLDICKHVWAVILAAEQQSLPLVVPGVAPDSVDLEPVADDQDIDIDDDYEFRAPPVAPPRRKAEPAPPWRQLLDAVGVTHPPAPSIRSPLAFGQLLYVIDVAATTASGAVVIELMTRDRKANGDWGRPRPARVGAAAIRALTDAADRQILERLRGASPHVEWSGWTDLGQELSQVQVPGVVVADIVPTACTTGRCMLRSSAATDASSDTRAESGTDIANRWLARRTAGRVRAPLPAPSPPMLVPIAWDDGPPWVFTVSIRHDEADPGYVVEGWLARDDQRMALADPVLLLADGLLFTGTHAARLDHHRAFRWLAALRRAGRIIVPLDARDELVDALLAAPPQLAEVPDDLRVETVQGQPRPHLRLRPLAGRADRLHADVAFEYEGTLVTAALPHSIVRLPGSTRAIRRDSDAERDAVSVLRARGFREDWSHDTGARVLQIASQALTRLVGPLLNEGWHVEAAGRTYRQPGAATLNVASGIDWFELHGHVTYDDQRASLPSLLAALTRGENFVALGDGTVGLLPEDWLRRHAPLAGLGTREGDHLRFTRAQVTLLDALIAAQPAASWDETFANAREELRRFAGIQPVDPPAGFAGTLRGYQREGLGWLLFLQRFGLGGCLADDMGLGKTVMVLALLEARRDLKPSKERGPSLVVAPRSLVFNWQQEAARFTPRLRVLDYSGKGRAALRSRLGDHDLVLTTYGTLRRDAVELAAVDFDYVVLDEAQAIKNATSVSAKTTRLLRARHRLALSGTPIENHLGELWSLFEFLNPGLLNTAPAFERAGTGRNLDQAAVAMLARALRPYMLRRTKDQVAADLPPKTEQTLYCELERPQRALYDELRRHYRRTLLDEGDHRAFKGGKLHVLEALLRLRQAACHPGLIDKRRSREASAKLDVLVPRLTEAVEEGHKTLVFSQFTSLLAILRTRLDETGVTYAYLDGRTRDRQSKVEYFQKDPTCRLFLISLKAGGLGLNLTAAEYVFLLDPWWNPAVEAQAIDRAHRIGQARHVFAYRLIARDTVEERVLELQQSKRTLADAILTADNSLIRGLKREDLELLLS
jgi:superfamily II DNA or RNA helicase